MLNSYKDFNIFAAIKTENMSFTDIINKTGELIESSIGMMKSLQNAPNILFITILSILFLGWIRKMAKFDKEAEESGTMR